MLPQNLTFGVEIECYSTLSYAAIAAALTTAGVAAHEVLDRAAVHRTSTDWKVVYDGSLYHPPRSGMNGAEVVSPILSGEAGLAVLAKVLDVMKMIGCEVNTSTGIHVHVGARNASVSQLRNVCKMFIKYETTFDTLVSKSRRTNNRFCKSNLALVAGRTLADKFSTLDGANTVERLARSMNGGWSTVQYNDFRYFRLNLQSMATHGTVEFRQHQGSVESTKVCAWVRLVTGFVATAMSVRQVAPVAGSFASLSTKVDRTTATYLDGRRAVLA